MMRNRQLVRLLRLIRDLAASRFGRTGPDLLASFTGTRRTFFRDLAAIEEAGMLLERNRRAGGEVAYRLRGCPCGRERPGV